MKLLLLLVMSMALLVTAAEGRQQTETYEAQARRQQEEMWLRTECSAKRIDAYGAYAEAHQDVSGREK